MDRTFPKIEKLKSKKLIEKLFAEGKSISHYPLRLVYMKTSFEDGTKVRAAVTASKRNFKSAVKRNRIKRLMRESYRLNKHLVIDNNEDSYALMFLYLGKEMPTYGMLYDSLGAILKKLVSAEKSGKQ
ncbi:MAG: ribonuclease P protein component [Sediminicola sp.]|tara:strand:- start:57027 stop:57410 length:384 start_codon:yes stop_codon:yes gene_type:complete